MTNLDDLLRISTALIDAGIIDDASSRPDRVSRIQTVVFAPDAAMTTANSGLSSRCVVVATAPGTARDVAKQFRISVSSVLSYRSVYRRGGRR